MRIGLFGGSFDPFHNGHLRPVREAQRALRLERVIYLPTARPPHKPGRQAVPAWARYVMVELALLREPGMFVSPFELTPGRPAYTIDSLEHFRRAFPDDQLVLLLGADNFAQLDSWKRWRELPELAVLAVLARPGEAEQGLAGGWPPELRELAATDRVEFVANRPVETSSTELRRLLAAGGEPPAGAMPRLVLEYVRKYSLYR